jgi:hypothetical protein
MMVFKPSSMLLHPKMHSVPGFFPRNRAISSPIP